VSSFADLRESSPVGTARNTCRRCGRERSADRGAVFVWLSEQPPGTQGRGKYVVGMQRAMCESCAAEVYELLADVLRRDAVA
jgi:hypothetical protein